MKTLYVSDLDGTLLNSNAELSKNTINTINLLIDNQIYFTIATARCMTSVALMKDVNLYLLGIQLNGVLMYDFKEKKYASCVPIELGTAQKIIDVLDRFKRKYSIYFFDGEISMISTGFSNEYEEEFFTSITKDDYKSMNICSKFDMNSSNDVIYFTMVDEYEKLVAPYEEIKKINGVTALLYRDNYSGLYFFEIFSSDAGKASAVKKLKEYYNADRLVTFGDNLNDIGMLQIADYALAMSNGAEQVKVYADEILDTNDNDGVAKFLLKDYKQ